MKPDVAVIKWLLEKPDDGIGFVVHQNILHSSSDNTDFQQAKRFSYTNGHIAKILKHMNPDGYWERPGAGYNPKYRSTVWSLILLSQLGASISDDERIGKACSYYLDYAFTKDRSISYNGTPSGTIDCLQGNMCAALTILGYEDDRLDATYDWMARSVTGTIERYYAYKCGPCFACGVNARKPCAWGAVKVMLAFGSLPDRKRTKPIRDAMGMGAEFLLGVDPATAAYPTRTDAKPNRSWWKFGFPVFYVTDILQLVEVLALCGFGHDPRLSTAIDLIERQRDGNGRWNMEYTYAGKSWGDFGPVHQPNKWVTYRALKVRSHINI